MEVFVRIAEVAAWPVVVLILAVLYWKFITHRDRIEVSLPGGVQVQLSSKAAGQELSTLFREFHVVYRSLLKESERRLFRQFLACRGTPTVRDLLPNFSRESEEQLGGLRALRGLGLITPVGGGSWSEDSQITVTEFGRALITYLQGDL